MRKPWLIALVVLLLLLSLSTGGCVQPSALAAQPGMARLVGSWQVETTVVKQATTFPALLTFTSDGIVMADEPPSPFETSGHGNWVATGPATADFTFLAFIGSAEGPLSALLKVVGSLTYDSVADTWQGPFTIQLVDAAGAEILTDEGTFMGTRIVVASAAGMASVERIEQPTAVFAAFNAAVNTHDVDKALSFFAADAIAQFPNQPPPNVYTGSAEIRTWLEGDAQNNIHIEIADTKPAGDTVSATASVVVDGLPPDLILVGTVAVMVKNGKITSFSYTLNDETLAKLAALESK